MQWFYAQQRQQIGPVDETELADLAADGRVTGATLVWRDGLEAWVPYREVQAEVAGDELAPLQEVCGLCGRSFEPDDVITLGGAFVCGECKPRALQQVVQGVPIAGTLEYAGFWIRAGARVLDWILVYAVNMILNTVVGLVVALAGGDQALMIALWMVMLIAQMVIPAVYTSYFLGRYGATLGKMACGLRVVTGDGEAISYLRGFGRHFAEMLSSLTLFIGYIMAAFDDERRTLHDRICNTRVIRG
ncbi:MAG: RDD family protein, partial [bacterium]|nr:RDD family protein [bacterium]